jgi:ribonuclease HI
MPIVIFADGASSGNPGPGGWGAIIVDEAQQVQELSGGDPQTTNNRMELAATKAALNRICEKNLPGSQIDIYTDSSYVIKGITQWIHGWKRNGWKTAEGKDVVNRDLWEGLDSEVQAVRPRRITWNFVPGHVGIHGNERADELAVQVSKGLEPQLYNGPLQSYSVRILEIPSKDELERLLREREPKKKPILSRGSAYYLSLVGKTPARHTTWAECEARVKGVSGARFKKVTSPEEEKETLKSWNVPQD